VATRCVTYVQLRLPNQRGGDSGLSAPLFRPMTFWGYDWVEVVSKSFMSGIGFRVLVKVGIRGMEVFGSERVYRGLGFPARQEIKHNHHFTSYHRHNTLLPLLHYTSNNTTITMSTPSMQYVYIPNLVGRQMLRIPIDNVEAEGIISTSTQPAKLTQTRDSSPSPSISSTVSADRE
jgi:hypothetical protein